MARAKQAGQSKKAKRALSKESAERAASKRRAASKQRALRALAARRAQFLKGYRSRVATPAALVSSVQKQLGYAASPAPLGAGVLARLVSRVTKSITSKSGKKRYVSRKRISSRHGAFLPAGFTVGKLASDKGKNRRVKSKVNLAQKKLVARAATVVSRWHPAKQLGCIDMATEPNLEIVVRDADGKEKIRRSSVVVGGKRRIAERGAAAGIFSKDLKGNKGYLLKPLDRQRLAFGLLSADKDALEHLQLEKDKLKAKRQEVRAAARAAKKEAKEAKAAATPSQREQLRTVVNAAHKAEQAVVT